MFNKPINRWWTVLAGALGTGAGCGVLSSYAFGVFIKPIAAENHWDRSITTASISSFYICSAFGFLVLGSMMSKWGLRRTTILFALAFAFSVAAVGLLPASPILFCLLFGAMGFFGAGATAMPYSIAISGWFNENRGLALAVAISGTGLGGIFMPRYANWLLQTYGWRGGYVGLGLFVGLVALIGLTFFFRVPKNADVKSAAAVSLIEVCVKDKTFWLIALPVFLTSTALLGVITALHPMLTDRGMSAGQAAGMLGLVGGASWFTRIGLGLLLDRFHVRYIAAPLFVMIAAGCITLMLAGRGPLLPVGVVLIGLGIGSEADLVGYTTSRYFGPRSISRAIGGVWFGFAWGSGVGVFIGSMSYDLTGSYQAALIVFTIAALASAVIVSWLGAYRFSGAHGLEAASDLGSSPVAKPMSIPSKGRIRTA